MNPFAWLCSVFVASRPAVPTDDPEVRELAERVSSLESDADEQENRLSMVEVRVGIRSPARWKRRDAG